MKNNNKNDKRWYEIAYNAVKSFLKEQFFPKAKKLYNNSFLFCLSTALLLNVAIELLGRRSVIKFFEHFFTNFHMFVFSTAVIMLTLCIAMFFKHRLAVHYFISCFWLGCGITNSVFLTFRATPLVAIDFMLIKTSLGVSRVYVSVFTFVLIAIALALAIALLVFLYKQFKDKKIQFKAAAITSVSNAFLLVLLGIIFHYTGAVSHDMQLPEIYDKCGYAYCLAYSWIDYGVDQPSTYNEEYMSNISDVINTVDEKVPEDKPNIIFLQLESFMDTSRIKDAKLSSNPHPFYTSLKENYPSGYLEVNALGAATANVEFEVLTGTYIKDYGFDEYPYKTFLSNTSVETIAYDLKNLGYKTTAMHNHDGAFYNRNVAYSNLGFDCFIPRECMNGLEHTPTGWAKDNIFFDYITNTLNDSECRDFIFAVTVQCHSKYPKTKLENYTYDFDVTGNPDKEYCNMLSYYAQNVYEEDLLLEKLINYLSAYDEKTIVVMYGDHLPMLIMENEQLNDKQNEFSQPKYLSEYVIWSNYDIKADDKDLAACTLSAKVLEYAGISTGNVMRLYQADIADKELKDYRLAITYDIVEGNNYLFGGKSPYKTTDIQIGYDPLKIKAYELRDNSLYVYGTGFTEDVKIYINNTRYASSFISENLIRVTEQVKLSNGDKLKASIVTFDMVVMAESESYLVNDLQADYVANKGKVAITKIINWSFIPLVIGIAIVLTVIIIRKNKKKKLNMPNIEL